MSNHAKVAVIGSGPAGLTAAIYLARASLQPVVFSGAEPGGQLTTTTEVGNFPGFKEDITGPELMVNMRQQAERFGTQFVDEVVEAVNFSGKPFTIKTKSQEVSSDSVIIATGASAKWLGLASEQRLRGKGVSACATCDGYFFKEKEVAVVGGGDAAIEEATFLTKFATKVYVMVRKDELRASQIMQDRANSDPKIEFLYNSEVVEVLGDNSVAGLKIKNNKSGEEKELGVQGLFVAIGHKPNTEFLGDQLELTKNYIKTTDNTKTSVAGVFTAGDVHDWRYKQAITAAGFGCMAALDAMKYLEQEKK
ncbi:thioredoxin-disulfide reductase [Patescibacteria group bacterium]|nr:thioredoxin-disulfide reductase [Patescibacteria group bacterium]MBU0964031.1 thioredoxin-disulfide reductase [Patescibacteria group bacterium]